MKTYDTRGGGGACESLEDAEEGREQSKDRGKRDRKEELSRRAGAMWICVLIGVQETM